MPATLPFSAWELEQISEALAARAAASGPAQRETILMIRRAIQDADPAPRKRLTAPYRAATTRDILIAAKALIPDEEHWWRGPKDIIRRGRKCYCPITAIGSGDALRVFAKAIGIDESALKVAAWNDDPNRTLAEVHAAFDCAIASVSP